MRWSRYGAHRGGATVGRGLRGGVGGVGLLLVAIGVAGGSEADFADELPRIDPLEPAEAVEAFEVAEGYRVELVAAEPLVTDPVAMAFDEDGRLYVVEMRGYSEDRDEHLGRIRILEDTNGDGTMDEATTFADGLRWPTAVFPWKGGVFVGMAPDLLYFADTTGDGRADRQQVIFSGMSTDDPDRLNVQRLPNSLRWGLDNRIHGTPTFGTQIHPADEPEQAIPMRRREFAFDPHDYELGWTSGGNQWGASFDAWGRLFTCINHNHNQMVIFEDRYVARNPHLRAPSPLLTIGDGGQRADLHRISPPEPWRVVRTRLRATGQETGPVERGGELHGYVSSAAGITIYQGDAYPDEMHNAAFIAAPDNNLVHRERLEEDGVALRGVRVDEQTEWLRTADNWFRPVWMTHAPDGTLWIADMYREVIEHPWSLPDSIKRHLDLTAGRDRGRIYRVVPNDADETPRPTPTLSQADTAELVELLAHANKWHRLTAARLLYERQDEAAVAPLIELLTGSDEPLGRLHAMYALDGLGALQGDHLKRALGDAHPRVRENALRLAEPRLDDSAALRETVLAMADDDDMRVRYQLAFTLGEIGDPARYDALTAILQRDAGDRWVRLAALSSLAGAQADVLARLTADAAFADTDAGRTLLRELARQVGAARDDEQIELTRQSLQATEAGRRTRHALLRGLAEGMGLSRLENVLADRDALLDALADMFDRAAAQAVDASAPLDLRTEAIETLGLLSFEQVVDSLPELLDHAQPVEVQTQALDVLIGYRDPAVAHVLIERWSSLGPRLRSAGMDALLARPERREALIEAIEQERFAASHVALPYAIRLRNDRDAELAERAANVLGDTAESTGRRELVDRYLRQMDDLQGDANRGRAVFAAACSTCHEADGLGHDLGPNLMAFITRGRDALVEAVLNPNAQVDPQFTTYTVETEGGETHMGVIVAESANAITLSPGGGVEQEIARSDIRSMHSTQQSLMPEGLEGAIDPQQMADLVRFLQSVQ